MLSLLSQCRCVFVFFIFHAGYLTKVCVYVRAHTHTHATVCWLPQLPKRQPHCVIASDNLHTKKRVALPSIHPFIHSSTCPPIVEKWNTLKHSYTTQSMPVCVCVCVLNIRVYVACMHIAMATSQSNWRHHFKTTFTASKEKETDSKWTHTHTLSSCYWCGLIFRWAHPIRSTGSSGT